MTGERTYNALRCFMHNTTNIPKLSVPHSILIYIVVANLCRSYMLRIVILSSNFMSFYEIHKWFGALIRERSVFDSQIDAHSIWEMAEIRKWTQIDCKYEKKKKLCLQTTSDDIGEMGRMIFYFQFFALYCSFCCRWESFGRVFVPCSRVFYQLITSSNDDITRDSASQKGEKFH